MSVLNWTFPTLIDGPSLKIKIALILAKILQVLNVTKEQGNGLEFTLRSMSKFLLNHLASWVILGHSLTLSLNYFTGML